MTEKQEKILQVSLELFANEGIKNTTTSMIAKTAGVSEGLIYRHFESKEGLIKEILKRSFISRNKSLLSLLEGEPKEKLRNMLNFPFELLKKKEVFLFWKFMIRIQLDIEKKEIEDFFKICDYVPEEKESLAINFKTNNKLENIIQNILEEMRYDNCWEEAISITFLIKGLFFDKATGNRLSDIEIENLRKFILKKYNIV